MDIHDKVALVTGGASGIGLGVVKALLAEGAKGVAIVDISDKGREVAAELNKTFAGNNKSNVVIFLKADVSDRSELEDAFNATVCRFKQLDIVINNAGIGGEYEFRRMYEVNLIGVANGTDLAMEEFLPKYRSTPDAVIVNTSSITPLSSLDAEPIPHYATTKFAVIGLCLTFGGDCHLQRTGVRVIGICPGLTLTELVGADHSHHVRHYDVFMERMSKCEPQDTAQCAKAFIYAIKEGKSGSIHTVIGGRVEEVVYKLPA